MDFRDTSLIVTLFTKEYGKIKAIVKGVKKEGMFELAYFEVLNHLDIVFYEKKKTELHLLSESYLINSMTGVRNSFQRISLAYYLVELIDVLYEPHQISHFVFDSLQKTLKQMEGDGYIFWVALLELQLLNESGLMPRIDSCVKCSGSELQDYFWSSKQGGLLCESCAKSSDGNYQVSKSVFDQLAKIKNLLTVSDYDGDPLEGCKDVSSFVTIEKLNRDFINYRLDRPLKSSSFIDGIQTFKAAHQ